MKCSERREFDGAPIPVLMVSANVFENRSELLRTAGCVGFVPKPVMESELLDQLREALHKLCAEAEAAVLEQQAPLLVLSDRAAGRGRLPVPSLLACGAVHQHLIRVKARTRTGILLEAGDPKEQGSADLCVM